MNALAGWTLVATLLGASADQHELAERCKAMTAPRLPTTDRFRDAFYQEKLEVMAPIIASGYAARSGTYQSMDPEIIAKLSVWTAKQIIIEIEEGPKE